MTINQFRIDTSCSVQYHSRMKNTKIRQKTVVEQVMSQIKNLIASGRYQPGDKIPTELELAEQFGVGRSSIREAIKIFNYLGVLKSQAAKGTFVQERSNISTEALTWSILLGNDEFEEMVDLRGAIELWSVISLTNRFSLGVEDAAETVKELYSIVEKMRAALDKGEEKELKELIMLDFKFHGTIIKSNQNAQFYSLYQTLRSFLVEEIKKSQENYQDPAQIPAEHQIITESVASGDIHKALLAYTDHIYNIKNRIRNSHKV